MKSFTLLLAGALGVMAQMPGPPNSPEPVQPGRINDLKAALSLTDQQVNLLVQNQRDRNAALRPVYQQLAERQRTFIRAQENETNAMVIGNIVLDMMNLRKQVPIVNKQYDDQALAVLTADQRPKLKALEDAMKLQPAIGEAADFGLLPRPAAQPLTPIGPIMPGPRLMHRRPRGPSPAAQ
jgi:hypothetical protein